MREYLPAEVGREEILSALDDWMKTNTLEKKTMGLAIRYIKQTLPMADGKLTSDIVKEKKFNANKESKKFRIRFN